MALNYLDKAAWDAGVYKDKGNDDDTQQDTSSEDSGYSASGILSAAKNFLKHPFQGMGTVIAPNYTPRPLDDSVYSDIPGTPVASGQFGELEDESVRDERMKDSADYMAANWPRLYGGFVAADEGLANVVGGIQNAVGGGNGILNNVQRAEEGMQDYREQWNNEYGDSYFLNPNKFATDVGSGIGSTVPIMALSALMPGAAVAGGTRALTSALSRAGLGRLAMSKAGQALIADTVRSIPTSNLADSLSEYGTVVNDMMQNGMSEDEARRRAIPMFFKNMALDTFTVPLELGVMKGGKGIATGLLGRSAGEGMAKSIAKGAARTGMLAGASGLTEGYQEGAQNALENDVESNRDGGWYNPFTWTKEDWEAARGGFVGGALMGVPGNVAAGFHPEARQAPLSAESQEQAQSIKDTLSHGKPKGMSNAAYNAYIELANSGNPDLIKQAASSLESFQQSQEGSQESTDDAATEAYKDYETYDQKQEIENFLNNNTVEQIGGEKNFNWLMGVLRNGTPEEVQHAYDTVIAAEKATAEQEAKNRPASGGGSMSPNTGNAMVNIVIQAANDSGVEPRLGLAIAARESGGDDVNAISMPEPHDGIYGIMQAQEETVSNMGLDSQYPDWKTDPYQNAMVGMAILKAKIDGENGDVWAGVRDYNGAGEEAEQYRQLVKNNYDNMGDVGGGGSGNVEAPSEAFYDLSEAMNPQVDGMDPNTMAKMNLLARDFYQKYGHRLLVTSLKRNGDGSSYHDEGHAFDFSDDFLEQNPDARDWLVQQGEKYGLKGLDEFSHPVATTDGGNVHFTDHGGPVPGGASGGVSSKVAGDNGPFERELDQAAQEAKSDMDKIQAQSDQAMNEIMNDDSAEKTAQDAQQDAENAQKQADIGNNQTETTQTQGDNTTDVNQVLGALGITQDDLARAAAQNIIGKLDDNIDPNDPKSIDKAIRQAISAMTPDEVRGIVNQAKGQQKAPSATPVPKAQQQTPHARLGRILSTYDRKDPKFKEYMNTFRNGTEQEQKKLADDLQTTQELERANSLKGNPLTTQQDQNAPQNAPQQAVESPKQPEQVNAPVQVKESLETQKKRKIYLAKKQKLMERVPAGKTVKVHASTNDAGFDATYKIVPAGDITASHDMNYAVNDLYPAEYQPRDRNRPQMRGQVEKMTKGMKPELLAESQFVNEGAPVVNNSGVVLNGNGRVMAVQKAYKGLTDAHKKSAKAYKDYLVSIAPSLGIAPEKVQSMDHPVLVRQAADDADTSAIINSTEGGAKLGGAEQAKADADRLKLSTLERFADNGTGEFMNPSNREFRRAAASDVFSDAEGNSVFNDKGDLSPTGAFRIRNAIFAKAYNDNYLLTQLSEATDNNSKNIMNAMIAAAPEVAKVNEGIKNGTLYPDYDISDVITKTAKTIMSLRNEGKPLSFHLQETDLFSQGESEAERLVLEFIERNKFKSRTIADMYKGACDRIFAVGSPKQSKLFDSKEAPRISLENIISNAIQEVEHGQSLFDTTEEKPAEKTVSEVPDNRQAEPAGSGRVHQQEAGRVQSQEKEGNEVDEKSKQSDHVDAEPQQTESKDKESTHAEEGSQGDVQEEVSKFHNVLDDEKSTPKQIIDAYKSVVDKVIANANGSRKNAKIGDKIVTDEYQSLTNSKHWGAFMNEDGGRNWHEVATINADAHKTLRAIIKTAGKETAPKAEQSKETKPAEQPKEKAGFTDDEIKTLTDRGFNRWTKKLSNGKVMDRLYIKPEYLGLELTRYKSGNISSAKFNGETISNSEARRIEGTKCYVDVATKEVVCDRDDLKQAAQEVVDDALSKEKSQVFAQTETKKAAPKDDVVVTGDEFGEYKDLKELRDKAKAYYKKHLQGTYVQNPILGTIQLESNRVDFTRSGMGKMVATSAKEHKLLLVAHLKELIENADSVTTNGNVKNKRNASSYSYLHSTAIIEGKKQNVIITIFTDVNGNKYYNHTLPDEEGTNKKEALSVPPAQATKNSNGIPAIDRAPSTSIISQKAEKGNNVDELRNQLSGGGKQAYDYAIDKLSKGNEKVAQSAKESAFIYARMAERWSEIMHEYGNKTYSPEDYTKSHPIVISKQTGDAQLEQVFEQRAWHGSGIDFDNFDLGKIGSGTGASMHGWGIYAAKSKRTAQKYKKEMKDRGLPSVLYEIDVPANKELLDEDKRYKDQMKGVQTKILKAVQSLSVEQKQAFWTKWLRQAMGSTKDEIQAETALRKVELNIKHCHDASLGWEGLPAFRKRIALDSLKKQGYTDEQINDTSYMKSESKRWEKELPEAKQQAKESKGAGDKKRNQLIEAAMENPEVTLEKGIGTGKEIYNYLTDALSDGKDIEKTSKYLNEQGIHGITYDDAYDGRCYVVFDDKAIQIINKYNQDVHNAKAAYDASTGAIRLFDIADQSSFIHESAHMFLSDMERLARKKGAPAGLVSDLQTVKDWAGYKPGQMNGYKDTALEKEFQEYADAIREAKKTGDVVAIKSAEARWIHERFARGFERYIAEGKAPNESLKNVFEKFKEWMVSIYHDLKNLGKKPPKEIQDVMARMITPEVNTKYSVREANGQLTRPKEDLKAEIKEAFPNAKEIKDEGDRMTFTMPNGSHIIVDVKNEILLTDEELAQAKKDHHIDDNGNVVVEGYAQLHGKDAYMALSQGSRENTGFHEAYHLAEGAVLTDREKAAIKKAIPDAEKRADKYAEWVEARKHGRGTLFGKLFRKIQDFAKKMQSILTRTENVHNVFRKIESGEVWNREASNSRKNSASITNSHLVGQDRIKVIDVSNERKVNINNNKEKVKIAKSLIGKSFQIFKNSGVGRIASISDGKHFVNSSNNPKRNNITRRKSLSVAEKILSNVVYVEKHPDVKHGSSQDYIELFTAVKDRNQLVRFRIIAKEGNNNSGRYVISDAKFYDIIKEGTVPTSTSNDAQRMASHKGLSVVKQQNTIPNSVSISELLAGVNDRKGKPYVNPDGTLNYEFGVLKSLPMGKASLREEKTPLNPKEREQEQRKEDILKAINEIVPVYTKSDVKKNAVTETYYDRRQKAGFVKTPTIREYGRILALNLDQQLKLKNNMELTTNVKQELEKNQSYAALMGDKIKDMTPAQARAEGVSIFGSLYFNGNEEAAAARFPKYYEAFKNDLKENKELNDKVNHITEMISDYKAQNPVLRANSGMQMHDESQKKTTKGKINAILDNVYAEMVDELDPLTKITKLAEKEAQQKLLYKYDVHKQALMAQGNAQSKANLLLNSGKDKEEAINALNDKDMFNGAIQYKVNMNDIMDAIKNVPQEELEKIGVDDARQGLAKYLIAMRTKELSNALDNDYVRPDGFDEEACYNIIKNAPESIKTAAKMVWDFNKNMINIMQQQGLINKKAADTMRKYTYYVPMYHDMSDMQDIDDFIGAVGKGGRGFVDIKPNIYEIKGGNERAIIDPIESMVRMTVTLLNKCQRNRVGQTLARINQDFEGMGSIIAKDPTLKHEDPKKCAFSVYIGGKKVIYRTTPEVYSILTDVDENGASVLESILKPFASALRRGATISPPFIVRNFTRDTVTAGITSQTGFIPFVDSFRGMYKLTTDKQFKMDYLASGASMGTFIRSDVHGAKDLLSEITGDKYSSWPKGLKQIAQFISAVWNHYDKFANLVEDGTRAGEFMRARKKGISLEEAGYLAKEVTLNFGRHGKAGKHINRAVPFFNATIQGTDKFIRAFKKNPARASFMTAVTIILPSIMAWALANGSDDDWYQDLDANTKYTNWCFKIGDAHILIPKPQEAGILFGSGVEAVLNQMMGNDPQAMKQWARQYVEALLPNMFPTMIAPIVEWQTNYSFWKGRALVGKSLQNLPSEYQYNTYTSEIAKALGGTWLAKSLDISPIAIDNAISGYFGSAGRFIANMLNSPVDYLRDSSRPVEPAKYWYEMPFVGSFVRKNHENSEYQNRFYDLVSDMTDDYNRMKHDNPKAKPPKGYKEMKTAKKTVSKLNKEIQGIKSDTKMGPEQKLQQIELRQNKIRHFTKKFVTQYGR
jgi:hypothetical protein